MNRKQLILEAKEMYPELFGEMQEEIQETIKELVQPIEGGDKAHTTHEKIAAKLEQDLKQAEALAAKRKELLMRMSELFDPISHEPGECEDCDLMREVMKELGDE